MDVTLIDTIDLNTRKTLGRNLLGSNQIAEAVKMYAETINQYPEDVEAYLVLGDLYLAAEIPGAAMHLYQGAQKIAPDFGEVKNRINLARVELNGVSSQLINPMDYALLDELIAKLSGRQGHGQDIEISDATRMLDEILHSNNPAELVAKNLDRIETMLPALLEVNIRQAKAEKRLDLVDELESIRESYIQDAETKPVRVSSEPVHQDWSRMIERVSIIVPDLENPSPRMLLVREIFTNMGCHAELTATLTQSNEVMPGLMIASNPHVNPWMLEHMAAATAARIPIILDLDMDYEQMPLNHPLYGIKGLGSPANARAYTAALLLANMITTPSQTFVQQLQKSGYRAMFLPDGWSRSNPLWEKPGSRRNTLNIGWIGGAGTVDDVFEIKRILIRVIREFPKTQLVIAEDEQVFQLFENLPENRKLFLPEVSPEDYPYLLGQMDILTVPYRSVPFNYSLPDTVLMHAGVKKVPWVSTNLPAASSWNSGGLLASTIDEWHTNLRQLVMDQELRQKLTEAGYRKSQEREARQLVHYWKNTLNELVKDPHSRGFMTRSRENFGIE